MGDKEVVFEIPVTVSEMTYDTEEMSDEELIDTAKEIMFSAPAFDGISEYQISQLEASEIRDK